VVDIRPYEPADLDALYRICLETGAAGEDATGLSDDHTLLGDLYAAPYGVLEPESAFVAEDEEGVAAYCLGALDTAAFHRRLDAEWYPAARERHPMKPSSGSFDDLFLHLLHHPHGAPASVLERYPSHLHIDLLPRVQGRGVGRRLMQTFLRSLADRGSRGVHFNVSAVNERALGFYRHLAFDELAANTAIVTFCRPLP
jgi:ribosomal protein S18 acetylase RimI-like enzyme